jgi:Transposase domain (DUF772)
MGADHADWVAEDDLAHFVIAAVERVRLDAFKINHRGTGKAQYHPQLMLGLLIYGYANGIFSSLRFERATYRDIGVRFVAADQHPDHDTIAAFLQVLLLARESGLLKLGMVSIDDAAAFVHEPPAVSAHHHHGSELLTTHGRYHAVGSHRLGPKYGAGRRE